MRDGLLWFDNSERRDLMQKIRGASEYYYERNGLYPTACLVHPSLIEDNPITIPGMIVTGSKSVLPNHFFMGMADEESAVQP